MNTINMNYNQCQKMETSEGRKTVRVGPDSGDGTFKTAISKHGFERNIHIFHILVNSFSGIFLFKSFILPLKISNITIFQNMDIKIVNRKKSSNRYCSWRYAAEISAGSE